MTDAEYFAKLNTFLGGKDNKDDAVVPSSANSELPPRSKEVVMKVLHTRTEITIYPNGQIYQQSKSWFEGAVYPVKKKEKSKAVETKKTEVRSLEEY
jgi:hypothetical protein